MTVVATVRQCVREGAEKLADRSDSARLDAELLLAHVLKKERSWLFAWAEQSVPKDAYEAWRVLLQRRVAGEPLAYILGEREFWSLPLFTDASTLIPRPDTEVLVEKVLALLPSTPCRILDLGTGTGAIALALAKERPDCDVDAVDYSAAALALAVKNRERHRAHNLSLFLSNWFSAVTEHYHFIVSNPPYIDQADEHLQKGDLRYEPASALVAAEEGLADIKKIVAQAAEYLLPQGWLLIEHGWKQKTAVQKLFVEQGYRAVETAADYAGNDRITLGQRP